MISLKLNNNNRCFLLGNTIIQPSFIYCFFYYSGIFRKAWCAAVLQLFPRHQTTGTSEEVHALPAPAPPPDNILESETKTTIKRLMEEDSEVRMRIRIVFKFFQFFTFNIRLV
jgi:hypothetical protein